MHVSTKMYKSNFANKYCKRFGIVHAWSRGIENVDGEHDGNKPTELIKRLNYFTTFVFLVISLVGTSLLFYRGSICITK